VLRPWLRAADLPSAAAALDAAGELDDLLTTAWELERDPRAHSQSAPWSTLVGDRATTVARALSLPELLPTRPPRLLGWAVALVLLAFGLQLARAPLVTLLRSDGRTASSAGARESDDGDPSSADASVSDAASADTAQPEVPATVELTAATPGAELPEGLQAAPEGGERAQARTEARRTLSDPGTATDATTAARDSAADSADAQTDSPSDTEEQQLADAELSGFRELQRSRPERDAASARRGERQEDAGDDAASEPSAEASLRREVSDQVVAFDLPASDPDAPATPASEQAPQDAASAMTAPLPGDSDDPSAVRHTGEAVGAAGEATAPQVGESQPLADTAPTTTLEVTLEAAVLEAAHQQELDAADRAWRPSQRQDVAPRAQARVTYAEPPVLVDTAPSGRIASHWREVLSRYFDPASVDPASVDPTSVGPQPSQNLPAQSSTTESEPERTP
jgi:hypothetical protein